MRKENPYIKSTDCIRMAGSKLKVTTTKDECIIFNGQSNAAYQNIKKAPLTPITLKLLEFVNPMETFQVQRGHGRI